MGFDDPRRAGGCEEVMINITRRVRRACGGVRYRVELVVSHNGECGAVLNHRPDYIDNAPGKPERFWRFTRPMQTRLFI